MVELFAESVLPFEGSKCLKYLFFVELVDVVEECLNLLVIDFVSYVLLLKNGQYFQFSRRCESIDRVLSTVIINRIDFIQVLLWLAGQLFLQKVQTGETMQLNVKLLIYIGVGLEEQRLISGTNDEQILNGLRH